MNIHFCASEHEEAKSRLKQLADRYGQTDLPDATHIVALGGDGHMLHVLQDTMSFNLPVFGLNCGRLGFLMNLYNNDDDLVKYFKSEYREEWKIELDKHLLRTEFEINEKLQ